MSFSFDGPLLLVGAGKMGGALLEGLIARGLDPSRVRVQDPSPPDDVAAILARHGIAAEAGVESLASPPGVILVAVKPQMMDAVFPAVAALAGPDTIVVSIAAGRTLASFEAHLAPAAAVVRAMPNTPAAVGRGITVCVANGNVTPAGRAICEALMSAVGEVAWVEDEALMDAVTAVSGSGPAYVFLLAEALQKAAISAGLDEALARQLARATVSGAGELLAQSDLDAAQLRRNVTSPGGTTAAALDVLMAKGGMEDSLREAVMSAVVRSRELAK
ncbi:pyrroline-5-carboxylate reductase [Hyphomicrobium sp.]|uniref:pyrroline-5-carboxylate reductase n=1 Tax=Hyphomicrobium sp. TaxID=82 RepID=UPI002C8E142F|nr:pyrroline-5-carboxylate reductase [Hyphomicrobium sp.]HRN89641.1 pyrroline-5-carboxylate reductase [Hyphomicrobium sp.]HRQ26054.1 pyrroline-5-carboxylate reductase [Hyphomicrobium sp.]